MVQRYLAKNDYRTVEQFQRATARYDRIARPSGGDDFSPTTVDRRARRRTAETNNLSATVADRGANRYAASGDELVASARHCRTARRAVINLPTSVADSRTRRDTAGFHHLRTGEYRGPASNAINLLLATADLCAVVEAPTNDLNSTGVDRRVDRAPNDPNVVITNVEQYRLDPAAANDRVTRNA